MLPPRIIRVHGWLRATTVALVGIVGVFVAFKGPNEWYAAKLESLAWVAFVILAILGAVWLVSVAAHLRRGHLARRAGPPTERPALSDAQRAEVLREAKARGVTDERILVWERLQTWLDEAIRRTKSMPGDSTSGDVTLEELDRMMYLATAKPLPVFFAMYERDGPVHLGGFFHLRPDATERAVRLLSEYRASSRPWTLSEHLTLDSFAGSGG